MSSGPHRKIRKSNILDKLKEWEGEYIPTGEIAENFDVSQETIRDHLEEIYKENEQIKMKNKDREGVTYLWMWIDNQESTEAELDSTDSKNIQNTIKDDAKGADQEAVDSAIESITRPSNSTEENVRNTHNTKDDAKGTDQEAVDSTIESIPEPSDLRTLTTLFLDADRSLRRHGRAGTALHQSLVQLFGAFSYSFFMIFVRVSGLNISYGWIDELTALQGTGALISVIVISAYIITKESAHEHYFRYI
jgi:DNA-binding transcriptional ArsR family regulator